MSSYSLAHISGSTTSRWGRTVVVATTRALPPSSQSRLQHSPNTNTLYTNLSRTRTAAVCDMSLLMHEIDGSEGEDNPRRVKRTRRGFPHPTYKASSACALRCSGAINSCEYYVVERSLLLIIFCENFVEKQSVLYSGFIIRVVDSIPPV